EKWRLVMIIVIALRGWRHPRVVRRRKGHICEKRLLSVLFFKKLDHRIGEQFTGKLFTRADRSQFGIRAEVPDGHLRMVGHAAEHHCFSLLKSPKPGFLSVVPFAGA